MMVEAQIQIIRILTVESLNLLNGQKDFVVTEDSPVSVVNIGMTN